MVSNTFYKSDLYKIHNVVQNSMLVFPKEIVVFTMRDFFAQDSFYKYSSDLFGYPQTPDHTDLPIDAGMSDKTTTRLFIGESFRHDVIYYPAIIVRHGGASYVPISLNQELNNVQYDLQVFEDGYGNVKTFRTPKYFIFAGAWEGSINIDIITRSLRSRDDLCELVSLLFMNIARRDLEKSGLAIKSVSTSAPSESDDRNDKLYKSTVTLQIRSEFRRLIPVGNIVEIISTSIEFGRTDNDTYPIALNLTVNTTETLTEILSNL